MADQVQWRGGSRQNSDQFTGAPREVTVDTSDWILRVHDGVTPGGHKMMKVNDCLKVETADKCNPNGPNCLVTVNGQLVVEGETNLNDDVTIDADLNVIDKNNVNIGGDLTVEGETTVGDLNVTGCIKNDTDPCGTGGAVEICDDLHVHGDVTIDGSIDLGDIVVDMYTDDVTLKNPGDYVFDCNVPDANGLKTQADANSAFYEGIRILDVELCKAQNAINALEYQYQQLEGRVDQNEIDIAAIKAEIDNLKQEIIDIESAMKLLELEIEKNQQDIEQNAIDIAKLQKDVEQLRVEIDALKDEFDKHTHALNDLSDVNVAGASNGQQLVYRNSEWVPEDNAFVNQAVHFKGFIDVSTAAAPSADPGDTYIQHRADEADAVAGASWVGITGETAQEGQYVMWGADSRWHKGKTVENVDQIQANWLENDTSSAAYIQNKPDLQTEIDAKAGDGAINVEAGVGLVATGLNATANQKGDTTRTLAAKVADGITINADGAITIDPSFNLDGNVTTPNDGKLTIKDSDGGTVGEFTANQAGNTDVSLPKGFSGSWNDLTDKPAKFPPEDHDHPYMPLDIRTLQELS